VWNLVRARFVSLLGGQTVVLLNNRALFRQLDHGWHDARSGLTDELHGCPPAAGRLVARLRSHTCTQAYITNAKLNTNQ